MNDCLIRVFVLLLIVSSFGTSQTDDAPDIKKIIHDGNTEALIAYLGAVRPNINASIGRGITMLSVAASENQPEIARILIEHRADVNAADAADPPRVLWGVSLRW
jgi:hypothetical protein